MTDYRPAWEELHGHLSWMQNHPGLSGYLGMNFAQIATDLIRHAYPGLAIPGDPLPIKKRPAPGVDETRAVAFVGTVAAMVGDELNAHASTELRDAARAVIADQPADPGKPIVPAGRSTTELGPINEDGNALLEARIRFRAWFPDEYANVEHILFRYNDGTWCANNLLDDLSDFVSDGKCLCRHVAVDVLEIDGVAVENARPRAAVGEREANLEAALRRAAANFTLTPRSNGGGAVDKHIEAARDEIRRALQSPHANVTERGIFSKHDAATLARIAAEGAAGTPWVPQIGERVEVTDGVPDAWIWRQCSLRVAGVRVHDSGDGLDVTVSEQWPIPSRVSPDYQGQTDDFRVGASAVSDMLRPITTNEGNPTT